MTVELPLAFHAGHLCARIADQDWVIDTGASQSFGRVTPLTIVGREFNLPDTYGGLLDVAGLVGFVGHDVAGIIGVDILNRFDVVFDAPHGTLSLATEQLQQAGDRLATIQDYGAPIISVTIDGKNWRMFLDTGAQLSYWQDAALEKFPATGLFTDFYPGIGQFRVSTYAVPATIGNHTHNFRCGRLTDPRITYLLDQTRTQGIIGNEILRTHVVGYFPRRTQLVIT